MTQIKQLCPMNLIVEVHKIGFTEVLLILLGTKPPLSVIIIMTLLEYQAFIN
jgi:hypothetical protein